jgi:cytochrome b pre-mRNA-processing protein 3
MAFFKFLGSRRSDFSEPALGLYRAAVAAARAPVFYTRHGVPDTPDGRFDMIALHVFLALRRLQREQGPTQKDAQALAQALIDLMFTDMDRNLREMGVGDLGVGRQVKALAAAFRGRIAAYDEALGLPDGEAGLALALKRNIFRRDGGATEQGTRRIARHVRGADAALAAQSWRAIAAGIIVFPAPPDTPD